VILHRWSDTRSRRIRWRAPPSRFPLPPRSPSLPPAASPNDWSHAHRVDSRYGRTSAPACSFCLTPCVCRCVCGVGVAGRRRPTESPFLVSVSRGFHHRPRQVTSQYFDTQMAFFIKIWGKFTRRQQNQTRSGDRRSRTPSLRIFFLCQYLIQFNSVYL